MGVTTDSPKYSLNMKDIQAVGHTALEYLAPLGVLYFGSVAAVLQMSNHTLSINDFIPNSFQLGAMMLYIVNRLFEFSKKFVN